MIKDSKYFEAFEKKIVAKEKNGLLENIEIYEAMWEEAKALGIFPLKDPYDGVEDDISLAKVLQRCP